MKILNIFLEIGEDTDNSTFIEIPIKHKVQEEINEILDRLQDNNET